MPTPAAENKDQVRRRTAARAAAILCFASGFLGIALLRFIDLAIGILFVVAGVALIRNAGRGQRAIGMLAFAGAALGAFDALDGMISPTAAIVRGALSAGIIALLAASAMHERGAARGGSGGVM